MSANTSEILPKDILDMPLFKWEDSDYFSLRNSLDGGVLVVGSSGSGKTSSSSSRLAASFLKKDYTGIVLSAKSEKNRWIKLCELYGRSEDLVFFGPDYGNCFNFFQYLSEQSGPGNGIAHNIADTILTVIKAGSEDKMTDKAFWEGAMMEMLVNTLEVCMLTKNTNLMSVYDIIQSAPLSETQAFNADWQNGSKCFKVLHHIGTYLKKELEDNNENQTAKSQYHIFKLAENFFLKRFPNLSERTRSIILQYFTGFCDPFMRDPLYRLFQGESNIKPEDVFENGKILVLDIPYVHYEKAGQYAQLLWKHLMQKSILKRTITDKSAPCFIWSDECHFFLSSFDSLFLSTCRDYRGCTVYITQNLPNMYLQLGGEQGKIRFRALAGNFGTKIFHANSDPETNEFSAEIIGKDFVLSKSFGETFGENFSINQGQSETMEYIVPPAAFSKLKTGGPNHNFQTEAIVHRQGKLFASTGYNYKKATFNQLLL